MRSVDSNVKKSLIDAQNAARKAAGLELLQENVTHSVGNNGYAIGQEFEFTGVLNPAVPVKNAAGGIVAVYIGLETTDGGFISLQSIMGVSSLRGYSTTEPAINETRAKTSKQSPIKSETINPEVIEDFDFEQTWKPETRDLYDMAAIIMAEPNLIKGRWQYCGTAVRQITAKKDASAKSFEKFCEGDKRAMAVKMWRKL